MIPLCMEASEAGKTRNFAEIQQAAIWQEGPQCCEIQSRYIMMKKLGGGEGISG